ncbi:dTDP-4-dehydrorhamnose reductase [Antrihabitans cavernicola]|uniref:dTDP-4-dehydrorhamnose reductase n=1 Tax=Antrihabitans cavernicola TaxID=2495913 RepID=A0A5A7SH21_9NOCA|nr:dTDP-4-dehydrorhamnose reductase [Spelaeibacter cavernicola]KAA0023963.1 dTDP-4-dehydrorhamnose reductase [Spelaeibacter cavernicola]
MPKIVITGARGQLGSQLVARGTDAGLDVVGLTSSDLDITDRAAVQRLVEGGSVVVNCAAYTAVDKAETDQAAAFAGNETGPRNLASACARVGARLIHVSTDYVFDGTADSPYATDAAPAPVTVYGRSKLAGELAVHEELPTAQIVRTAWVYTGIGSDFVATMCRLETERDTVDVVDDQIGSPTYAADLADGLLELVGRPDAPRLLHLTNGGQTSWFELARAVFTGVGADGERVRPCSSDQFVRPAKRPAYSVLSGQAWVDAGLAPLREWRSALESALAELPSNQR